jgi:hypothetical protein
MSDETRRRGTDPPRCDTCGAAIPWTPVYHRDGVYCCGGCAQGGPCYCSYDLAIGDHRPIRPLTREAAFAGVGATRERGTDWNGEASTHGARHFPAIEDRQETHS